VRLPIPLLPRTLRIAAVALVAAVICYFSVLDAPPAQPPAGGGLLSSLSLLHVVAYAGLSLALAYATVELSDRPARRVALVLGVAVGYGVAVELLQAPLPERYYSVADMVANALGASAALGWLAVERVAAYVPVPTVDG
jgi:VanZ family protein